MNTESIEALRAKARDAVVQALGNASEITDAVFDALGIQDIIKERDRLREAVIETARVIESDDPAITDTLFTTDGLTTLYDCCLCALGIEDSEDVTEGRNLFLFDDEYLNQLNPPKLNPPETAPKDRRTVICGDFGAKYIQSAIWNPYHQCWSVASLTNDSDDGYPAPYFETNAVEHEVLRGWLPMQKIDDEGNVK